MELRRRRRVQSQWWALANGWFQIGWIFEAYEFGCRRRNECFCIQCKEQEYNCCQLHGCDGSTNGPCVSPRLALSKALMCTGIDLRCWLCYQSFFFCDRCRNQLVPTKLVTMIRENIVCILIRYCQRKCVFIVHGHPWVSHSLKKWPRGACDTTPIAKTASRNGVRQSFIFFKRETWNTGSCTILSDIMHRCDNSDISHVIRHSCTADGIYCTVLLPYIS